MYPWLAIGATVGMVEGLIIGGAEGVGNRSEQLLIFALVPEMLIPMGVATLGTLNGNKDLVSVGLGIGTGILAGACLGLTCRIAIRIRNHR